MAIVVVETQEVTMASSIQLTLGSSGSLSAIKSQWLKHNQSTGFQVQVSQNVEKPKARHFSVCHSAPKTGWKSAVGCRAHVKAVGTSREEMKITSCDLVHTCVAIGNNVQRKRNYLTRDISEVSEVVDLCQPTTTKEGDTKQFISMTKAATGISVKNGQANLAVRSKSHNTIEAQMGQHFWLPSLFAACKEDDPVGTFKLESIPCRWDQDSQHFCRCHVALSFAKRFWKHGRIDLVICDGTHTRGSAFKHIILFAVTFDGNNQLVTLAFAIVAVENSDDWVWFKECLDDDFPGHDVWMSDADKGIHSNAFSISMSQTQDEFVLSRCTRHLAENCRETCEGPMNEHQKNMIIRLAKARTQTQCQERLSEIEAINEQWAQCLHSRQDEFATVSFLNRGCRRFGKVTSNGVENINSALSAARSLPTVHMIQEIVQCQQEKFKERKKLAEKWVEDGTLLTQCAPSEDVRIGELAQKREVDLLETIGTIHKANVSVTSGGTIEASVDTECHSIKCPCRHRHEEFGAPCVHGKALLLQLGGLGVNVDWWDARCHISSCSDCHSGHIAGFTTAGRLQADDKFIPPEHKRAAGRPGKKRKDRSHLRSAKARRECKACGQLGHFASTCENPSTQCRHEQHKQKAIQWCRRNEIVNLEED